VQRPYFLPPWRHKGGGTPSPVSVLGRSQACEVYSPADVSLQAMFPLLEYLESEYITPHGYQAKSHCFWLRQTRILRWKLEIILASLKHNVVDVRSLSTTWYTGSCPGGPLNFEKCILCCLMTYIYIYIYICRTAPLTSRCFSLNIYSTNIRTEYFKHAA
jgi:hypothetical protein